PRKKAGLGLAGQVRIVSGHSVSRHNLTRDGLPGMESWVRTLHQLHGGFLDEVLVQMLLGKHLCLRGRLAGLASLAGGAGPAALALHPPFAAFRVSLVLPSVSP